MPIFDYYIMVDWTGGNSRKSGTDSIWIAHGPQLNAEPHTENPLSRSEAISRVINLACGFYNNNPSARILGCFDFAFRFPRGFATHLPRFVAERSLWARVRNYLHNNIQDDLGTNPGRVLTNKSNRFDVANDINAMIGSVDHQGPFWCPDPNWRDHRIQEGLPIWIPQTMPPQFVSVKGLTIPTNRLTDERVRGDCPFRIFGNGSVGSQTLTGIPRLQTIQQSQELAKYCRCQVWPFETGWANDAPFEWLGSGPVMILSEIYPSVRAAMPDDIRDRGQVRAIWHWARDLDHANELNPRCKRPDRLTDEVEQVVRLEEGWVLH